MMILTMRGTKVRFQWNDNSGFHVASTKWIIGIFLITSLGLPCSWGVPGESDSSASNIRTVKGLIGDKVSIPCDINTEDCGDVYFVAWTRNNVLNENSETWSRVYMYSENINKPLQELSNRAVFQLPSASSSPASAAAAAGAASSSPSKGGSSGGYLLIDNLKPSDEAYYKCDITYISVGKCPSLTYIHLAILAPPSRASIWSGVSESSGQSIESSSSIGPYNEGVEISLYCSVSGGKPLPTLEWWSVKGEERTILSSSSTNSNNITSLALNKKIDRSDLNRKLHCHVKHESIQANDFQLDSMVSLDVNVGASNVYIVGPIEEVKENDLITIKCIAIGSRPQVTIEWFNGTETMSNVKLSEEIFEDRESEPGTKRTESIMELYITRFDHLSTIECRAINPAMNEPVKATIQFKVFYSPTIVMEPENGLKLQENQESINIYCTYNANPMDLVRNQTRWYKDSTELDIENSEGRYLSIFSGYPILSIINVTKESSGTYYCSITNEAGTSRATKGVSLNIIYRPKVVFRIYPDASGGMMIKEGDDIQLICDIEDGNPMNASKVRWIRTTSEGSDVIINETSQNEIVWLSVDRSLSGNYSCSALNEAGWSPESNSVELDVKYLPSSASIQQINGNYPIKGEPLILECIVHSLGWPLASEYLWEQDGLRLEDSTESILNITNVTLSTRGNYSCAAISSAGLGPKGFLSVQPMVPPRLIESLPAVDGALFNATSHSVSCRVECDPPCIIKWYLNGSLIDPNLTSFTGTRRMFTIKETQHPEERDLDIFLSTVSTLTWDMSTPLSRETDNSEITCSSTNNIAGPGVESNMAFKVEYPPESLSVSPQVVQVIEGQTPEAIKCHSDALPEASYRWERWGVPIVVSPMLEIHNPMTQETGGNYSCVAYNRHGTARIDAVINVLHKPVCEIIESEIKATDTSDGSSSTSYIVLICEAIANPSDNLAFSWIIGNSTFTSTNSSQDIVTNHGTRSQIVIPPDDESMFGTWNCSVSNSIGSGFCLFNKSAPLVDSRWTMPHLDEKSIILIAGALAFIIIIFIIILIIMFCRMKNRRAKQEIDQLAPDREKTESDRTSTPSSYLSNVPSNKGIKYLSESNYRLQRNDRIYGFLPLNVDVIPSANYGELNLTPNNGPNVLESTPKTTSNGVNCDNIEPSMVINTTPNAKQMYENMTFHRKDLGSLRFGPLEQNIVYADLQLTYDENDLVNNKGYQINTNLINVPPSDPLMQRNNSISTIKSLKQQLHLHQQQLQPPSLSPSPQSQSQRQYNYNNQPLNSTSRQASNQSFTHSQHQNQHRHQHHQQQQQQQQPFHRQLQPQPISFNYNNHYHPTNNQNNHSLPHPSIKTNYHPKNQIVHYPTPNPTTHYSQHPQVHPQSHPNHNHNHSSSSSSSQPPSELSTPSHQIHYASSRISDYAVLRFDKTPSPPSIC